MKKIFYLAAASAMVLASCSNNDMFDEAQVAQDLGSPVSFGTYTAKATRAGQAGSITTEVLKGSDYGFGVFAFYTEDKDWKDVKTTATPDWMWNQKVAWNAASSNTVKWEYAPIKYWPNDNKTADDANAQGTTTSKISFFAYAPYAGDATTGLIPSGQTTGIISVTDNGTAGDPKVTYAMDPAGKNVDLLWGTAATTNDYQTVANTTINGAKAQDDALAATNINLIKLKTGQLIKFNFKHALAKIGGGLDLTDPDDPTAGTEDTNHGLQIQLDIDKEGAITGGTKGDETIVTVKTIKIENDADDTTTDYNGDGTVDAKDHIFTKGTLDLATGLWTVDESATSKQDINHVITSDASASADKTAKSATLSDKIAEPANFADWSTLPAGVLTTPQNVYGEETNPFVFIPGTAPAFKITVTYIVRTKDAHLKKGWTEAEQTISKLVSFPTVELNKRYNLVMHLGLSSIRFTATVENWEKGADTDPNGDDDGDGVKNSEDPDYNGTGVNLPINVK